MTESAQTNIVNNSMVIGFRQTVVLLEGSSGEARSASHIDNATTTCDEGLFEYMMEEQLKGIKVAETTDHEDACIFNHSHVFLRKFRR